MRMTTANGDVGLLRRPRTRERRRERERAEHRRRDREHAPERRHPAEDARRRPGTPSPTSTARTPVHDDWPTYTSAELTGVATVAWYVPHPLHAAHHRPQRLARRLHHRAGGHAARARRTRGSRRPATSPGACRPARRARGPSRRGTAAARTTYENTEPRHSRRHTHPLALDDPDDGGRAPPRQSSSVRPVRIRNTSSSVLRRTSTDVRLARRRRRRASATGVAVVGVDEHPVGQRLDPLPGAGRCAAARLSRASPSAKRSSTTSRVACCADQLARRALGDDAPAVHDHEAVAQLLGLVHVVRREHEGHALALQLVEALPQEVARLRVEAGRRLVEQQQLGLVDERAGDREPALHAARERVDAVARAGR